uniref:Endonuclease, Uma2 family (Restriction endonuclease fold) n=1 Tax=uncultured Thiotrichaceae bacterium TaxID=298394 RepID=A0A6S6SH54_9GAMM|nr:MAG: Endonuclease, Uma2 family (Restriction endonuclease fold) [uncultured Thiotrichaceae bacterium]
MAQTLPKDDYISFEDYLAGEQDAKFRSEYIAGHVYAMAGASELHNTVATTLASMIDSHLPDKCRVWQSDMKVVGNNKGDIFSYYPDIMASCEENDGDNPYVRSNPGLIVEVLSPSTKRVDFGEKFNNYITIPSLVEYVVVSQDTPFVQVFRRQTNWQVESHYKDDTFSLESVGLAILVRQIYRRVKREVGLEVILPK